MEFQLSSSEWKNGVVLKPIIGMGFSYKTGDLIRFKAEKIHVNVKVSPTVTVETRSGYCCIFGVPLRCVAEEVVKCPGSC